MESEETTIQEEEAKSHCSESLNSNKTSDSGISSKIDDFSPSTVSDEISIETSGASAAQSVTDNSAKENDMSNTKKMSLSDSLKEEIKPGEDRSHSMETEESGPSVAATAETGSGVATKRRHPNRVYRSRLRIDSSSASSSPRVSPSRETNDTDVPQRISNLSAASQPTASGGATNEGSNSQNEGRPTATERADTDPDNSNSNMELGARVPTVNDADSEDHNDNNNDGDDEDSYFGLLPDSDDLDDEDDDDDDDDEDYDDEDIQNYIDEANPAAGVEALKEVLSKPKPNYRWNSIHELMRREHGLDRNGRSLTNGISSGFQMRFYGSRHVVERMKMSHCLRKHNGCVNCLNFNKGGDLLCSGSDDKRIVVWNWAENKTKHVFKSGHTENIFQTKFIDSVGCLDIISASRDGQVRRSVVPPSGGNVQTSCVYKHNGAVHKLVVSPQNSAEIISVGEDAFIHSKDLRCDDKSNQMRKMVTGNKNKSHKVRLYSISHHPYAPEICVCGSDCYVRVYDKRNMKHTVHEMCPENLTNLTMPQITCCVYDSTGNEVLASYSDDNIFLFNNRTYKSGEYLHRYAGHYNHRTIKGVNFFGPNSEYVVSGSDCGNIFFWDKGTEAILNFMNGDTAGVVNCLEGHPNIPVLATSGLDHNIKVWTPSNECVQYPPVENAELEKCVKRNLRRSVIEEGNEFDDRQFQYFIRRFMRRSRARGRGGGDVGSASNVVGSSSDDDDDNDDILSFHWSRSSSSESSVGVDDYPQLEGIQCRTQ